MTFTHNQIVKLLQDTATNHQMIKSFGFGDIWKEGATEQLQPTVLWGIDLEHKINRNVQNETSTIDLNYKLIIMDLVDKGENMENDVLSDTLQITLDVLAVLGYKSMYPFYQFSYSTIKPFTERLDSEYTGHEVDVTFTMPFDNNICQVPLDNLPTSYTPTPSGGIEWSAVPSSRTLTINGVTYDLSANRTWTISSGGNETLAQTLALGNTSGANNIIVDDDQYILLGTLSIGGLRYNSVNQNVILSHISGGQSLSLTPTGEFYLSNATPSRVWISDANGYIVSSSTTDTQLSYLDATSSIQTQLDSKANKKYFIRQHAAYTLTSQTAAQKLFDGSANGAITLPIGAYRFTCQIYLSNMSTTSGNSTFSIAGTAVTTGFLMHVIGYDNAPVTTTINQNGQTAITSTFNSNMHTASTSASQVSLITGTFEISTGGTIIPSIALTTAAAATVNIGSYFEIEYLGLDTVTTSGTWS